MLTVLEALKLAPLQSSRLLTPKVKDRTVLGVSVIETPVESFVRPGELVLTTAMGLARSPQRLEQFVLEVANAKAAALVIGVGGHVKRIPVSVIAKAERLGLPLIQMPWEERFSDVIESVLRKLLSGENLEREREHLVWSLLQHNPQAKSLEAARALGLQSCMVAIGRLERGDARTALNNFKRLALEAGRIMIGTVAGQDLIVLIEEKTLEVLPKLNATLERNGQTITWGLSESVTLEESLVQARVDANLALEVGLQWRSGGITTSRDAVLEQALLALRNHPAGQTLLGRVQNLLTVKEVETLAAIFRANGNITLAAKNLKLRRQSLIYRLEKLEQKTLMSLENPRDRFTLELAYRLTNSSA
jgi:Purine catabolism regulatory protein-like family/PucR C-terminal helix-turn-helix domain